MDNLSSTMVKSPAPVVNQRGVTVRDALLLIVIVLLGFSIVMLLHAQNTLTAIQVAEEIPIADQEELSGRPVSALYANEEAWIRTEDVHADSNGKLWTSSLTRTYLTDETSPYRTYLVVFGVRGSPSQPRCLRTYNPELRSFAVKVGPSRPGDMQIY